MPHNRSLPANWASHEAWFKKTFDLTQKVAVYWPDTQGSISVEGYYDSVSEANTAATAAISGQRKPRVAVNFWHTDFTHVVVPPLTHRKSANKDGAIDLPSWYDEEPAS